MFVNALLWIFYMKLDLYQSAIAVAGMPPKNRVNDTDVIKQGTDPIH